MTNNFGEFLKQRRKDLGMTMTDVQTVVGISQPAMSQYENGMRRPKVDLLIKLADLYELSHEEMIQKAEDEFGKEKPPKSPKSPKPPEKVEVKNTNNSKAHRFNCKTGHAFYIPLNLPISIEDMVLILGSLQCPICHCGSKDITFNLQEFTISE